MANLPSPEPEPCIDLHLDLPDRREGKVRVSYALADDQRLFLTTDRLSAFDRVIRGVPYKGQVLNQLAAWWFECTADIVDNHALVTPDPNALVAVAAQPLPIEVVVRGYITGSTSTSLWMQYEAGARMIYGHRFPDGISKNTALPTAIVTPTTKAEHGGHDEPLTCADVVTRGLLPADLWSRVQDAALAVFARGQRVAEAAGLILADTKYEFGLDPDGGLLLIDEIHTPDSSRFWFAESYAARHARAEEPESFDKEYVRRWLAAKGFTGEGPVPTLPDEVRMEAARRYIDAYERITGTDFVPDLRPPVARIKAALGLSIDASAP